jgi:mannose-1-phosphate guanylyltransferase
MSLHIVILAGGRGVRFWPLSRRERPKQLLPLLGTESLLRQTAARFDGWVPPEAVWIVSHISLIAETRRELEGLLLAERCIEEPIARNTAAAIGAAAAAIETIDPEALMLACPSDHWIPDTEAFRLDVERASRAAAALGGLHLFGIPITRPECGYGYVECAEELAAHPGTAPVARFHEKPDPETAVAYASRGEMLWNSGIFLWKAATILEALDRYLPQSRETLGKLRACLKQEGGRYGPKAKEALRAYLEASSPVSIDCAVLEKHATAFVTRATFRWSDLGNWLSWGEKVESDAHGNQVRGKVLIHDSRDCVLYSEDGLLALLGVEDLIVVRLGDVTLVCSRERAQEIRDLVDAAGRREDLEEFL